MNPVPRILVTRPAAQAAATAEAIRRQALQPIIVPAIEIEMAPPSSGIDDAARWLHTYRWVVVTSPNGARAILAAAERVETHLGIPAWAVIGPSTRLVLDTEGIEVAFMPATPDGASLAAELAVAPGDRVLVIRGDLAGDGLATTLRRRGARVDEVIAYRTREAPRSSLSMLREAVDAGPLAAIVFTSGSTVRGLIALARDTSTDILSVPTVCIGRETVEAAMAAGFEVAAIATTPDPAALAAATAAAIVRQPEKIR